MHLIVTVSLTNGTFQSNFKKSLLSELKISNILLLQDFVDEFATIARHGEENGSSDHIITLKDPKLIAEVSVQNRAALR
jgi:hypothetical protein